MVSPLTELSWCTVETVRDLSKRGFSAVKFKRYLSTWAVLASYVALTVFVYAQSIAR